MKKHLTLFAIACLMALPTMAQFESRTFKPFKLICSMGYAKPRNLEFKYPLNFQLEPKYGFTDNLWLGIRFETCLFVQQALLGDDYKALAQFSIVPSLDYSLVVNEEFRPFIGLGAGTYTHRLYYDGSETAGDNPAVTRIGFCPRIGFEYRNLTLSLEHNFVDPGVSFSAIKAGFAIGGGTVD